MNLFATPSPQRPGARILPRAFYDRSVHEVARDLLGMVLVRAVECAPVRNEGPAGASVRVERLAGASVPPGRLAGRIVEVEAYDGVADLACHASRGRTERTEPMFGEAGRAYIYLVYGMHCCLNVVTGPAGHAAAVLIRALEPLQSGEPMVPGSARPRKIAGGPGRLTRALRIGLSLNRADLCAPGPLFIEAGEPVPDGEVLRGPRVGVEYAGAWARRPWRLGVRGSCALSRPFPGGAPGRTPTAGRRTHRRARRPAPRTGG